MAELDLSDNKISDAGTQALAEAIMTELDLTSRSIFELQCQGKELEKASSVLVAEVHRVRVSP